MKNAPLHPERATSIARWENEGGASPPPSKDGRDAQRDEAPALVRSGHRPKDRIITYVRASEETT